ncbi:mitogen-activated protein kinase [Blastocystis sp. subtype 4]|uniref:mitogen-activated protein kinase n=1 Tax=Blastocystis sp. subtype 4 TaxID=944170 RepID=UPI0007116CB2|nr:mitogen-activated protein kinase [Blastocystis sp. subtype 4]KNB43845.1 mitogen-activated protein kinase [Blastocystis sp. subtype 4]|eukprot:XP_014527288.1 mitogen-activated protein kinase [Blastocystis sp. subtype 4]
MSIQLIDNRFQGTLDTPDAINSQYIIIKELGKGAYGTVYLAEDRKTHGKYAVKRIDDVFRTKTDAKRTLREITILRQCNHPNIAKLVNVLLPPDEDNFRQLWIVQEYGGWDLSKVMKSYKRIDGWCDKHVKSVVYQMLCGLLYMQSANLVHRDLKPSNILVDNKCNVKIIDYGLARQMCPSTRRIAFSTIDATDSSWEPSSVGTERQLTQHVVTRWYRAPELILMQSDYGGAIDVWSVGCIMAELLQTLESSVTRIRPLFPGTTCYPLSTAKKDKNKKELFEREFQSETHQLEKIFEIIGTPSIEDIKCMENVRLLTPCKVDPRKRITVENALRSPFFDDVRNDEYETVSQQKMVFPFEHDPRCGDANEKKRLRQLIYKEALIFS